MNSHKAPGIDGFNVYFYKRAWSVIGPEVTQAIRQFMNTGYMPKDINRALIVLIPKSANACTAKEFRPIACCTVLYKIISKVLANRLQGVLHTIIGESQSAFIKGRVIFDNIILSHELVKGYTRKNISPRCMIKVDLQKAYDSVEWPFLKYLLLHLGFPYKFVEWVIACITTVSYTINVNGELTKPFEAKKGLRQGDPISPYLFVLCMEYLNRCLKELYTNRVFKFHPRCRRMGLTHLCFADDLLLFTRGDLHSIQQLFSVFQEFIKVSGLQANQGKSCIYFGGVAVHVKEAILEFTGMTQGALPFKYLGVPLSTKKLTVMQCTPLLKKVLERVDCWESKLLTYAGRVQLIRSVLYGMQVYWCQIFVVPQKVIKLVQTACRTFLWTGKTQVSKRALIAWDKVCLPKYAGGLGLINMAIWNKVAVCKLLWNLAQKKDKIWVRWVHGYYVKGQDVGTMQVPTQCSWVIKKILGAKEYMQEGNAWLHQPKFSTQRMYRALRGEVQKVEWDKMISHNRAPPKYIFISWLLMHERMVTCDYLSRMGIVVSQQCCLCDRAVETLDHLFFECSVSQYVWTKVANWCGIQRQPEAWSRERVYLISQCKTRSGKQCLYRCMVSIMVYEIWKERNSRRMKSCVNDIEAVVHRCIVMLAWGGGRDEKLARTLQLQG